MRMEACAETDGRCHGRVRATVANPCGARYVVGCDGGRSATRRLMGVSFDGTTSSTRWLVIDCANDPLGHPNSEVGRGSRAALRRRSPSRTVFVASSS